MNVSPDGEVEVNMGRLPKLQDEPLNMRLRRIKPCYLYKNDQTCPRTHAEPKKHRDNWLWMYRDGQIRGQSL